MVKINEHEKLTNNFVHSSQNLKSLFGTAQTTHCKNGLGFNKHMFLTPLSKTPLRKYNDHFVYKSTKSKTLSLRSIRTKTQSPPKLIWYDNHIHKSFIPPKTKRIWLAKVNLRKYNKMRYLDHNGSKNVWVPKR